MKSRRGVTLLEVLVSIFIMGIGMLAILVLFPLGALNMARALKDDRTGTIAANADSMAQGRGLRSDTAVTTALAQAPPNSFPPNGSPPNSAYPALDPNRPTYPVIIDPYYASQATATNLLWTVGTVPAAFSSTYSTSPVQRISPTYLGTAPATALPTAALALSVDMDMWFSFQDDLTFESGSGLPLNWAGGGLQRQGWYTWSYCLQRPVSKQPPTTEQLTVIVYKGRPVQTPTLEPSFQVSPPGNANDASLSLVYAGSPPDLVRGNWLMDCTPVTGRSSTTPRVPIGYAHGKFYRVMDAFVVSPGVMQVEVYPPLLDANVQWVVVMEYASEIFTRPTGSGR